MRKGRLEAAGGKRNVRLEPDQKREKRVLLARFWGDFAHNQGA
jgi:hypothetical protein